MSPDLSVSLAVTSHDCPFAATSPAKLPSTLPTFGSVWYSSSTETRSTCRDIWYFVLLLLFLSVGQLVLELLVPLRLLLKLLLRLLPKLLLLMLSVCLILYHIIRPAVQQYERMDIVGCLGLRLLLAACSCLSVASKWKLIVPCVWKICYVSYHVISYSGYI